MRNLFTLLFVFFLYTAHATNYYFSSVSGDDARTAPQASSPFSPWKTLGKLNSIFSTLKPGDSVLLKRGETFYGPITVNKSGTYALPIVIGAYGSGDKPVITSLVTLSNWVSKGNGIWESSDPSLGATLTTVIINNNLQEMGRYPNSNTANKGYLTFESHTSNSITDNNLNALPNWTGSELVLRTKRWVIDRCPITSHSGNTITFTPASGYSPVDNFGYFIQNDIRTLDQFGEWYYNPTLKTLSVYFGSSAPTSNLVQATSIDNLINSANYNYIVFDNLAVKGANADAISLRSGNYMAIKNCDAMFSGGNGITVKYSNNLRIENCTISNSNNNGIDLGYTGDYAIIRNNKITNTSVFAGLGQSGDSKGFGIFCNGNNTIIEYNQVINTGYVGINFNGDYTVVKNNFVDGFCLTKDDGSGIYTFTGSVNTNKIGRKVIGNIVINGMTATEGVSDKASLTEGIYMDDNSSGVEISGNTVSNVPTKGIFLHNSRDMVVTNNTVYNNKGVQLCILHDTKGNPIRNCTVTKNNFFAKTFDQDVANFKSIADDNDQIGRFDSNYYARPIDDRIIITNSYVNSSNTGINENLDLEAWKNRYNKDSTSKRTAKQIDAYRINSIIGLNKVANGTFTSNANGVLMTSSSTAWINSGQLDGGYLEVTPTAKSSSVYMRIGGLEAGKKYLLRYSVKGANNVNMTISSFLRKDGSPYNNLTPLQTRKVSTVRSENEMLFLSSTTETAATVFFSVDNQSKYYIDNIQVYEADAAITNIDDSLRFEYNASTVNKTVNLEGNYVDAQHNKYSNSIVLQPYTSAVLIKDGGAAISNSAPSVSIISPDSNSTYTAPATVNINATATDSNGTISKVEFYNGSTLLGTDTASPYVFTWTNISAGKYFITAKATDNSSLTTVSDTVAISVVNPNVAPSVSITSPAANAAFAAPASITINATATDSDGTISKVDFYSGTTLLGTDTASPYVFTWNNISAGNYSITAKATDNGSLVTTSAAVNLSVNAAPSVSITSPVNNTTFAAPASITINATAADSDGTISKVDFYNGTTLLGTDTASPYVFTWTNIPAGNYSITAKATDNGSLVTTSAAVNLSVNAAPSVSITSPVNNITFAALASITINATATDSDGAISKVEFYSGTTLLGTDTASPYVFIWNNIPAGNYSITAKATDNGSLVTTSAAVNLSVNAAPSVSITSPVNNTNLTAPASITINATAADSDGTISKVEFYNGTTLLGTDTASPYVFTWKNVPAGNYTITAKATDNVSLVTTSAPVTITVLKNIAPVVVITSPVASTQFTAPAKIYISASASDADGTISKVEFYNGSTLIRTENLAPYTYSWTNVPAGNYTITAKATDNKGTVTTSASVTITVAAAVSARPSANKTTTGGINIDAATNKMLQGKEDTKGLDFKVFPNPAVNKIQISVENKLRFSGKKAFIKIQNMSGIVLKSIPVSVSDKTIEADISFLRQGIYLISLVSDDFIISRKFIKN